MKKLFVKIIDRSSVRGYIKWINVTLCLTSAAFWLSEYLSGSVCSLYWEGIFITSMLNVYLNWSPTIWNVIKSFIETLQKKYMNE